MILFVLPRFSGGGAERVTLNLLVELYNRGHSVGVIVFDRGGPLSHMVSDNIPIYNLDTLTLTRSIVSLVKKIRQLKPRVVFSTLGYVNVAILSIRWFLPQRTKIWIREANLPSISLPNSDHSKLMTFLYRFLYRRADKVICTSIRMKNEFISKFSISDSIMHILPNPVNVDLIRISFKTIERFDKGGVCYIAAGRLSFQKGFDRLLHWFSEINNKKSTLVILGDGSLKDELMREVKLLNIQNRVKFIGFCNNPWQWYAGADVFLLSSRWEGMPNSALEALACGTPVIATKESGGIDEIVKQGDTSITIVTGPQQFIHAMNNVKTRNKDSKNDSLLPDRYKQENATLIIEKWLNEISLKND